MLVSREERGTGHCARGKKNSAGSEADKRTDGVLLHIEDCHGIELPVGTPDMLYH